MYIPPSQYKTGFFSNNEYNLSTNNEPYKGPYWVLNNGKPYTGNSPSSSTILLLLPENKQQPPPLPLGGTEISPDDNSTIGILAKNTKASPRLIPSPFSPTIINSQNLSFTRYFCKKNSLYEYLEIDQKTYSNITSRNSSIAWDLYEAISLTWIIKGERINVQKLNNLSILNVEDTPSGHNPKGKNWIGFSQIFNDYLQFYQDVQENLYTDGGEYKTPGGREYIGFYHIHPQKGPMVGAIHVSSPHDYLYPINLPIPANLNPTQPTSPTYTPPPSTGGGSYGGGSSGGGGGGY